MKKLFLAVALVMGLGTSVAFANNMVSDVEIATMINEFKPIDVKELPQAVQDAIKENYSEATIKEAAVEVAEDGTKTYKVTLVDASGTENPVLFNEKGEVFINIILKGEGQKFDLLISASSLFAFIYFCVFYIGKLAITSFELTGNLSSCPIFTNTVAQSTVHWSP